MAEISLTTLLTRLRARTDTVDTSNSDTDAMLTAWLNEALAERYSLIIQYAPDTVVTSQSYTTDGTANLAKPSDYRSIRALEYQHTSSIVAPIFPLSFPERNRYNTIFYYSQRLYQYYYTEAGSNFVLSPVPPSNSTIVLWYILTMTRLSDGSDTVDFTLDEEDFVLWTAAEAVKMRNYEVRNDFTYKAERARERFIESLRTKNIGIPKTMIDYSSLLGDW